MRLSTRRLNRALLDRQLLLGRARISIGNALERVGGLQAQYAPSPYVRLWSMLEGFERDDLTRALERRRAVQGTLMRSTIHLVSPRDYWSFPAGVGPSRRAWWLKTWGRHEPAGNVDFVAGELEAALAGRTWRRAEIDALLPATSRTSWTGTWIPLVRVPPSGTWERRRADLFRLAAEWIAPEEVSEEAGLEHLLRRYLAGFGPARPAEAADWAGVPRAKVEAAAERLRLRRFDDEDGRPLLDFAAPASSGRGRPRAPRFLGTWDAALLVHARRAAVLPERFRSLVFSTKQPQSVATFLVDGAVAGRWHVERAKETATLRLAPFEPLPPAPGASSARRASDSSASTSPTRRPTPSASRVRRRTASARARARRAASPRSTSTQPSPRASQSVRAWGLISDAARIPRHSASSTSRWMTSR